MKNSLILLEKQEQSDPRIELEPETLALAKRNSFPLVAQRTSKKDGMGLAMGAAGALMIGAVTFVGLSGGRLRARRALATAGQADKRHRADHERSGGAHREAHSVLLRRALGNERE